MLPIELPVILFYLFSFLTIGSSLMVITSRDPVRAVLFLILAFFNAAGIFLLLKAELIAMLLVIVYVGAVAVLFLFIVMMLNINKSKAKENVIGYAPLGIVVAIILFVELFFIIQSSATILESDNTNAENNKTVVEEIVTEEATTEVVATKEKMSSLVDGKEVLTSDIEASTIEVTKTDKKLRTNTEMIGMVLYTDFAYLFQLCGLILLVAMIGAISLAHRQRDGVRKQKISDQLERDRNKTIEVVKVESGKGV